MDSVLLPHDLPSLKGLETFGEAVPGATSVASTKITLLAAGTMLAMALGIM
jgi:hypothetical protein